ncbi:Nnf1-domain-containing protein [Mycena galopus ATCC 62051]|nr:Nnf1-domain-containing protein [Mycena galopus ATCC 62051]
MSSRTHSGGSRRWSYFHSALELAVQRSAHKWKFEDFAECFPQYVAEDKEGAIQTFNQVADYIEAATKRDFENVFKEYDLQNNIDILDKIVSDAKARKASGKTSPSVWTANLHPRSAVCGRTIPILEAQADRLRESLAELETENIALASELEGKVGEINGLRSRAIRMLDLFDTTHEAWSNMPMEEIQAWTAQIAETTTPALRS